MFGIGLPELLLILALALIVVGPDKLPELARSIAKTLVDLKKTAEGLKDSFNEEDNPLNEIKPQLEDAAKNFKESVLDQETATWKSPSDLSEFQSIIDATTEENAADADSSRDTIDVTPPVSDENTDDSSSTSPSPLSGADKAEEPPEHENKEK